MLHGPWLFLFFGMQIHLVYSDAVDYEDVDTNRENNLADYHNTFGGFGEPRANQMQYSSGVPCHLMTGYLKHIKTFFNELEAISATYCSNQPTFNRFQQPFFPSFPNPMDFMQFPQFPQFPQMPNIPFPSPPSFQPLNSGNDADPTNPNPSIENLYQDPTKIPEGTNPNPWSTGIFGGSGSQIHKKVKVKGCNQRRSGSGKKKHAAANAAVVQKGPEAEKNNTTEINIVQRRGENEVRRNISASKVIPVQSTSNKKSLTTDEKPEKVD